MDQVAGRAWVTTQEAGHGRAAARRRAHRPVEEETAIRPTSLQPTCAPARSAGRRACRPFDRARAGSVRSLRPHRDAAGERRGRPESPDEVVLEFNEEVDASLGSLRVFDGQGVQVDDGEVTQPVASEVAVGIDSELAPGMHGGVARGLGRLGPDLQAPSCSEGAGRGGKRVDRRAHRHLPGRGRPLRHRPVRRLRVPPPGGRWVGGARRRPSIGTWRSAAAVRNPVGGCRRAGRDRAGEHPPQGSDRGRPRPLGCALVEPVHVGHRRRTTAR